MKGVRVFYKAWFPKAYDPDKESANRELLGMIVCNLEKNHTYDIKMLRGGVMKISIPHEFGQLTLPDYVIGDLRKTGLEVQEIRYMKDITADQLFGLETYARRWGKTTLPIETLKNGIKMQWRDAPYGSETDELLVDD